MSTIEEVRVAENNVKSVLDALKKADRQDQNLQDRLSVELKIATDQYAKAIRELNSKQPATQHDSSLTRSKEDENI